MNIEKIFKNLIIVNVLIFISYIFWGFTEGSVEDSSADYSFSNTELIFLIVMFVYFINFYFLFKFKPLGRTLFVPLLIIIYALCLGLPDAYFIYNSIEYVSGSINAMIDGMIVAILYLTDIKNKFNAKK